MFRNIVGIHLVLFVSFSISLGSWAGEISVAVASNFAAPMKQIAKAFEQQTQNQVRLSFGSSNKLFSQISNGAPFDLFLSADQDLPRLLIEKGLAVAGSQKTYAQGYLALWSSKSDLIDSEGKILESDAFKKLAMANPALAPYGLAAQEVLKNKGLLAGLDKKIVKGESIGQTYQFVATGNAELGFVSLSQALMAKGGSMWRVPEDYHRPLKQDMVLLLRSKNNLVTKSFMEFLKSPSARAIINEHGYSAP